MLYHTISVLYAAAGASHETTAAGAGAAAVAKGIAAQTLKNGIHQGCY